MEMYFWFWPPEGEHIISLFISAHICPRERETDNISQQWFKSFMTSKTALGKYIVYCGYIHTQAYTPILIREYIKIISNL